MTVNWQSLGIDRVLHFPITAFAPDGALEVTATVEHVRRRMPFGPGGVFVACGTGEFSSLIPDEFERVVRAVVSEVAGRVPVIAGAGHGAGVTRTFLDLAADAGADGVLLFPPTGPRAGSAGLAAHYASVASTSPLPLILYQRDGVIFDAEILDAVAAIDQIVGIKDGVGDSEQLQLLSRRARGRWALFNGLPTAEASALTFGGLGVTAYSSATFAFFPEMAVEFKSALTDGVLDRVGMMLDRFFVPLARLRDRGRGYAVSLVKAGLELRGETAGAPRPPLDRVSAHHYDELARLIEAGHHLLEEVRA